MLHANVHAKKGDFQLDIELTAESQRPLVLVGESGAGKTTFLEVLAGLAQPTSGRIVVDETVWFDEAQPGAALAAHHRSIGYVAQEATLFPHLTVVENVAFGLKASGESAHTALTHATDALETIGIGDLVDRRPRDLSGGQQQRVTLARALCLQPRLLLLDEPLSSLDIQTKRLMRGEIRRVVDQLQCITVYVTHDPLEALTIADRVAVIEKGKLTQLDDRAGLLRQPRSQYVGRFVGVNLFRSKTVQRLDDGMTRVTVENGVLHVVDAPEEGEFFLTIDPTNITLSLEAPAGSARNVFTGQIEELTPTLPGGERVRVGIDSSPPLVAEITRSAAQTMPLALGMHVYAAVKATAIMTYQ